MTKSETWKDVAEYEGFYQVSNKGNVRSVDRRDLRGHKRGGRILKPTYDKDGYLRVTLCKNGKHKTKKVHRLVAESFIPNPESLSHINHMDEVKDNNESSNLEWCTHRYNMNYGTLIERTAQANSKKVKAINVKTGEVLTFNSVKEAGSEGYGKGEVSKASRGIYKNGRNGNLMGGDGRTYKGYRWSYEQAEENEGK